VNHIYIYIYIYIIIFNKILTIDYRIFLIIFILKFDIYKHISYIEMLSRIFI